MKRPVLIAILAAALLLSMTGVGLATLAAGEAAWVETGQFELEGGTHVTRQGIVRARGYWYSTMSLPTRSTVNGRLYRYNLDGSVHSNRSFEWSSSGLPFEAHASSLDYSPVTDRLYWAWMQPNLSPGSTMVTEHHPVTLEITRQWDTTDLLGTYLDAVAIDGFTGDMWLNSRTNLYRVPYGPISGFRFGEATTYPLQTPANSREDPNSEPRIGNFSGLRIRGNEVFAFTHTERASWPDLGPRYNNGLVVYKMGDLSTVTPAPYDRFYRYWFPDDRPDQEGGDIVGQYAIISTIDARIWELRLK